MFKSKRTMAQKRQPLSTNPPTHLPSSNSTTNLQEKASSIFNHLIPPTLPSEHVNLSPRSYSRTCSRFLPIQPQANPSNLNPNVTSHCISPRQEILPSHQSRSLQPYNVPHELSSSPPRESNIPHSNPQDVSPYPASHIVNVHHSQLESQDKDNVSDGAANEEGPDIDLLTKVEIVGKEGNVEMTSSSMKAKDVFKMAAGLRIKVHVNIHGQPIRAARKLLTGYMTKLIKQPNLCPPDLKDFHEVKNIYGVELLRAVREKFSFPPQENVDDVLIALFNSKYRNHKYRIRSKVIQNAKTRLMDKLKATLEASGASGVEVEEYIKTYDFKDGEIEGELNEMGPPAGFAHHQWLKFKMDMNSEKAKELSKKGKNARATQTHIHTTGSKSYAQLEDEYVIKHKVEPGLVKFFELTHKKKDGSYAQDESRQFMVAARSEIEDAKAAGSYTNEKELENNVWYKLMGEDSPGRARGYGIGVTKSQVLGFRSQLKRMRSEKTRNDDSATELQKLQVLLRQQQETIAEQQQMMKTYMSKTDGTIASLRDEVHIYRTAFGSFAGVENLANNAYVGVSTSQDPYDLVRRNCEENIISSLDGNTSDA